MAVFRVEKTKNFTVMSNYHLNDKKLSLKAITSALEELKQHNYLQVNQLKGNI